MLLSVNVPRGVNGEAVLPAGGVGGDAGGGAGPHRGAGGGAAEEVGTAALALVHDLFAVWHRCCAGPPDRAGLRAQMQPVQDALDALLDTGIAGPDAKAATLCRALDRLWPALWTFVDADGVEPTGGPLGDRR